MSISSIHNKGVAKFQSLLPKTCQITTQKSSGNYANKSFIIPEISAGKIEDGRLKKDNTLYTSESVVITIRYEVLKEVMDRTNTIKAPLSGYKNYNSFITYRNKKYIVEEESENEFDTTLSLYCDTIG